MKCILILLDVIKDGSFRANKFWLGTAIAVLFKEKR